MTAHPCRKSAAGRRIHYVRKFFTMSIMHLGVMACTCRKAVSTLPYTGTVVKGGEYNCCAEKDDR